MEDIVSRIELLPKTEQLRFVEWVIGHHINDGVKPPSYVCHDCIQIKPVVHGNHGPIRCKYCLQFFKCSDCSWNEQDVVCTFCTEYDQSHTGP